MTTRTHTYSDSSVIQLGSEPGKGWLAALAASAPVESPAPRRRSGRALTEALREPEGDRKF